MQTGCCVAAASTVAQAARSGNRTRATERSDSLRFDTIRGDNYFNVRSKADTSQLNLPHGANN